MVGSGEVTAAGKAETTRFHSPGAMVGRPQGVPRDRPGRFWEYFLLGALFWVCVDFTTAFAPDVQGWVSHMPLIFAFYFGSPLVFAFLIYRREWSDRSLLGPMLVVLVLVEVVFSHNALLYTFPLLLIFIPLAVAIYSFLTYVPRWIIDRRIAQHRMTTLLLVVVWLTVAVLSTASRLATH